jgi:hypothetical protein
MNPLRRIGTCCLLCIPGYLWHPLPASPQTPPAASATNTERDGQHDFDFELGTCKSHISRRLHPLTGSTTWVKMEAIVVVRKVEWRRQSDGARVRQPDRSLRRIEPAPLQSPIPSMELQFFQHNDGTMAQPLIGEFKNGRGEFIDQEPFNGKTILVRQVFTDITPDSHHFEQAFSDDGGKTWEPNFIATLTRTKRVKVI